MPGDPKECREHAKECLRIAEATKDGVARETFEDLAKTWLRLAADLERGQAMLDTWGDPRTLGNGAGTNPALKGES